jgi:hypothetical protein
MEVIPLIPVELTPDIAVKLRFMMASGVFDLRGGNAILSFGIKGDLKSIKVETYHHAVDK